MGSATLKSNTIKFAVPEGQQGLYERFNKIRIVQGLTKAEAFTALVEDFVSLNSDIDQSAWVGWDEFESRMKEAGYSVNRVTMWKYKNERPEFEDLIKSDGTDGLWNIDGILAVYRSNEKS